MPVNQIDFDKRHFANLEAYSTAVRKSYLKLIRELEKVYPSLKLSPKGEFYFSGNKALNAKMNTLIRELNSNVYATTVMGINSEWDLAVEKNNEITKYVFGKDIDNIPQHYKARYLSNNGAALDSFLKRKDGGFTLSEKVWRNSKQVKTELELAIETGLRKGTSAQNIARDIKQYLNDPNKLFRKVRDNQSEINQALSDLKLLKDNDASLASIRKQEDVVGKLRKKGNLRLSKAAQAYNPGQGRYRSSYKNALRLARNEVNFAYEGSQFEKRKQQDFIVGIQIQTSPSHNPSDDKGGVSCISLAGKYPKNFNWVYKWHVNCICYSTNIIKTREELDMDVDQILAGKEPTTKSSRQVSKKPGSYTRYVSDNKKKWKNWKNPPRFIVNN